MALASQDGHFVRYSLLFSFYWNVIRERRGVFKILVRSKQNNWSHVVGNNVIKKKMCRSSERRKLGNPSHHLRAASPIFPSVVLTECIPCSWNRRASPLPLGRPGSGGGDHHKGHCKSQVLLSCCYSFFFLRCIYLKGTLRERMFHLLVHSPNDHRGQSWARPNTESRGSIWVSHVSGRGSDIWGSFLLPRQELEQKWSSLDLSCYSDTGWLCHH